MVQETERDTGGRPADNSGNNSTSLQDLQESEAVDRKTLHNDAQFASAVDSVAANVGDDFRDHAIKPRTHTTRKEVMEISRLGAGEQREVAAKVREGAKVKEARQQYKRERKLREAEEALAEQRGERPLCIEALALGKLPRTFSREEPLREPLRAQVVMEPLPHRRQAAARYPARTPRPP